MTVSRVKKKIFQYGSASIFTVILFFIFLFHWANSSVKLDGQKIISFQRGSGLTLLSYQLESTGVVNNALLFKVYTKLFGKFESAQAGTYSFKGEVTPAEVISAITSGKTHKELFLTVTIPEGFTLEQVLRRLEANKVAKYEKLKDLAEDKNFLTSLGIDALNLEGYLYPETYNFFEKRPTAKDVFETMVNMFFKNLPKNYEAQVKAKGLSLTEAITFASLIEKETMKEEEKNLVSEVIWNRLKRKMALGIDAAIIYGIEDYDGDLKWKDLKNKKNPYNTRLHRGLPPGPIGAVSKSSLEAVLTPSNYGYLYYVLLPNGDGFHKFSKTLREHNKYVEKLIKHTKR